MIGLSMELLTLVVVFEAGCLLVALGTLFGHAVWQRTQEARYAERMDQARTMLTTALGSGALSAEDVALFRRLPIARQAWLLSEWGSNLSGRGSAVVSSLSQQLGMVRAAERMCLSWRWAQRVRGVRILTMLAEGSTVVPTLFDDRSAVVRSQVAYWAATHPTPDTIAALLRMLGDRDRFCRFAAMDALHRMGTVVIEPLVEFVTSQRGPTVDHAMAVISVMGHEHFLHVGTAMMTADSPVARAFAAKVLGAVGGVAHVPFLLAKLADSVAGVREAAVQAIGGIGHWQSSPKVAQLLLDPEWNVRRAAGLSLRDLGAPGRLFLRRAVRGSDQFAADMAKHVLDLPVHGQVTKAA